MLSGLDVFVKVEETSTQGVIGKVIVTQNVVYPEVIYYFNFYVLSRLDWIFSARPDSIWDMVTSHGGPPPPGIHGEHAVKPTWK